MQQRSFDNPKIEFIWNSRIAELVGEGQLTGVVLESTVDGSKTDLPLEGLFIAIGNDPRVWLVENQVKLSKERFIEVDGRSSKTSLPGVFACGDVIDPTYRQAITAAGSGCVAALDAEHYLSNH
jgi:thioredoxin reductase (NADPH)